MRRLVAGSALLLAVFGGLLAAAGPASAHAGVRSSTPADGQRLRVAPARVSITFDEGVGLGTLSYLDVTDGTGRRVDAGAAFHPSGDSSSIAVNLQTGLADGTYTESYRVVSADSHPVAGVVRFVVGSGALVTAAVDSGTSDGGVAALFDVSRWLSYAGVAVLAGAWLMLTVWPSGRDDRRARRIVWTGWALAVVATVLELCLQGAYVAGRPVSSAFDSAVIDATLHTDYGRYHSLRLALLGVTALVFGLALQAGRERHRLDHLFWPVGLGIAFSFAATGHAETTHPVWLSLTFDTLHLTAMAVWIGGLVLLVTAILPRREAAELDETLPVFSRVAFTSVLVLAVTGSYAAWRGVGSVRAIVHTEYGLLVVGKIALFLGLVALGNVSRVMVQRRLHRPVIAYALDDSAEPTPSHGRLDGSDDGDATGGSDPQDIRTERMRRSVLVELVVAVGVLVLTAVLVTQPRGAEALAAQVPGAVTATAPLTATAGVQVSVDPGRHGIVGITLHLTAAAAGARAPTITGTATELDRQIGPIPLPLERPAGDSSGTTYVARGVNLPVAGHWTLALTVTSSSFDAVSTDVVITLP